MCSIARLTPARWNEILCHRRDKCPGPQAFGLFVSCASKTAHSAVATAKSQATRLTLQRFGYAS